MHSSVALLFRSLPLKKSQLNAVDFALNCTFRKIFSTPLKKWLKCVNRYSVAKLHPMQWQTESVNF